MAVERKPRKPGDGLHPPHVFDDDVETAVEPYPMDDGIIDKVPVYRVTPILSAHSQDVMASVQEWWDALPAAAYGPVSEHITWKMDGCTFDLKIRSNDNV